MLIGIVGKPSSGKSTFLNATCMTNAKTANYPFTTVEPNLGTAHVRVDCVCKEFNVKDNPKNSYCVNGQRFIPVKMLDVAGLVPEAHKGRGMGNKFLSDLSRADALIHVVDISGSLSADGDEVDEGSRDPLLDIKFLEDEINYWFFNLIVKSDWNRFVRKIVQEKLSFVDVLYERLAGIRVSKVHIKKALQESGIQKNSIDKWSEDDLFLFVKKLREISKPIVIAANKIDRPSGERLYNLLKEKYSGKIIPCSGLAEYWLRKFDEKNVIKYLPGDSDFEILNKDLLSSSEMKALNDIKEKILHKYGSTGVQDVLNYIVFNVLNMIVVYPVADAHTLSDKDGNVLPDAFLVPKGMKLKEFIEQKIHTDLAKNFIYAVNVRTNMRIGEDYELKNNDVIKIVAAV